MDIFNITTYLANCINEIWKREVMNYDLQEDNYENIIEEFFQKCCNSDNTTYNGISYYNYKIDNIYECINYINKKNNEIYGEDIPVYYLLNEENINQSSKGTEVEEDPVQIIYQAIEKKKKTYKKQHK